MPTTVTATVGVARDYTSLQDAYDDIGVGLGSGTDLVANDEEIILEIHADAIYRERVTFDRGLTADSTRRVTIRPAAGDEHEGVISASKVIFSPSSGTGHNFTVLDDFIKFERLQVALYSGGDSSDEGFRIGDSSHTAEGTEIFGCLIYGYGTTGDQDGVYAGNWSVGSSSYPILVRDCAIWGWGRGGIFPQAYNQTPDQYWQIVNCACVANQYGIPYRTGLSGTLVDLEIINTIVFDNTSYNYGATGTSNGTLVTTGSTNNFDSAGGGTTLPGLGSPNPFTETESTSPGAGDWGIFENFSGGGTTWDLRLVNDPDNDLLGGGVGPASNSLVSTVDALGNTRSGTTCDPGFFEATVTAVTEDADLLELEGSLPAGELEASIDADLLAGEAALPDAALEASLNADVLSLEGSLPAGSLEYTEASDLLSATGTLPDGTLEQTVSGDLLSAEGVLPAGDLEASLAADLVVLEASLPAGSDGSTEIADLLVGEASLPAGSLEYTENADLLTLEASLPAATDGSSLVEDADLLVGEGVLPSGALEASISADLLAGEASLPAGALEYTENADLLAGEVSLPAGVDNSDGGPVTEEADLLTVEGTLPDGLVSQVVSADVLAVEATLNAAARPAGSLTADLVTLGVVLPVGLTNDQTLENADVIVGEVSTGGVTWIRITENADLLVLTADLPPGVDGETEGEIEDADLLQLAANLPAGALEYTENADVIIGEGYITLASDGGTVLEARELVAEAFLPDGETAVSLDADVIQGFGLLSRGFPLTATLEADGLSISGVLPDGIADDPSKPQGDLLRAVVTLPEAYDYKFLVDNSQRIYKRLHEIIDEGPFYQIYYDPETKCQELVSATPITPDSAVLNEVNAEFGDSRVRRTLRFKKTRWAWVAYIDFNVHAVVGPFEERWLQNPVFLPRDTNNGLDAVLIEFDRATYRHSALQGSEAGTSFELSFFCTPLEG